MAPRIMGDTIHNNVQILRQLPIQLVAGYDTGTPDIRWVPADWNLFPDEIHVHIDQAFGDTRAIEAHVLVFDVEAGAFRPDQAAELINNNTSPRPTIYVNRDNMYATIASAQLSPKWHGDIWLAFPGWKPGEVLPKLPLGCRYVAIQNVFGGNYDTSIVVDDSWPDDPPDWRDSVLANLAAVQAMLTRTVAIVQANTP